MVQAEAVQRKLETNWPETKKRIRQRWRLVTDNDLEPCHHDIERLIRLITLETGDPRERVEHFLTEMADDMTTTMGRAAETVRDSAYGAIGNAQRASHQAARWSEEAIRARPAMVLACSLVAGLATGYAIGAALRR